MSRIRLVGAVLFGTLLLVPAAHANFPSSLSTTVTPGGNSTVTSPTLSPSMKSATVDVVPPGPTDAELFRDMRVILSAQPTPGRRMVTCIEMTMGIGNSDDDAYYTLTEATLSPLSLLLMSACLHLAAEVNREQAKPKARATPRAALAARCRQLKTQIGATYKRVGSKYTAKISGKRTRLKTRSRVTVTCKRKGRGLSLKVRPAAKGKSLRSVVGPQLLVGVYNPLEAKGSAKLKFTFRR
jgi:hypothetical protein